MITLRVLAGGALVGAAVAMLGAPAAAATGNCLAWIGSRNDGRCIAYSNGSPTYIGTPQFGVFGSGAGNGLGIVSGPLLPGTTISQGISP